MRAGEDAVHGGREKEATSLSRGLATSLLRGTVGCLLTDSRADCIRKATATQAADDVDFCAHIHPAQSLYRFA